MGEDRIGADAQNLGILCRELSVIVVRTGRLQLLDSGGAEVEDVKIDENILSSQAAELQLPSLRAIQLKVRRLLPDLKGKNGRDGS